MEALTAILIGMVGFFWCGIIILAFCLYEDATPIHALTFWKQLLRWLLVCIFVPLAVLRIILCLPGFVIDQVQDWDAWLRAKLTTSKSKAKKAPVQIKIASKAFFFFKSLLTRKAEEPRSLSDEERGMYLGYEGRLDEECRSAGYGPDDDIPDATFRDLQNKASWGRHW